MPRSLIILLSLALALRLGWVLSRPDRLDDRLGDQFEYMAIAQNIINHHSIHFHDARYDQDIFAKRTPGYPLFLAGCGGHLRVAQVAQALIDTSTALAVYLLARRLQKDADRRFAVLAAGFVALNPYLIYFSGLMLAETLYTSLLAWSMALLVTSRHRWMLLGVVLLALSVTVRPSGAALAFLLPAIWASRSSGKSALGYLGASIAAVTLVLFPWASRNANHPVLQTWIWTTTNAGVTTYDGFHDQATGASDQKDFLDQLHPRIFRMDEVERDRYLDQQARQWVRDHPLPALKLAMIKMGRTWSPIPLSKEYGNSGLYVLVGLVFAAPLALLTLLGLLSRKLSRLVKVFLLLPAIYFTVIHALSVGSLRYRMPAEPPMALLAACGALILLAYVTHGQTRRHTR